MSTLMHQRHLLLLEKKHRRNETTWFVTKSALKKGETRKKNFHVVSRRCCSAVLYWSPWCCILDFIRQQRRRRRRRRRCNKRPPEEEEQERLKNSLDVTTTRMVTKMTRTKKRWMRRTSCSARSKPLEFARNRLPDYVHLCRVFPRKLYREMTEYFPPKEALAPAKLTSHKLRYKIDRVGSLLDLPEAMKKTFKNFTKTVEVWSKAEEILLSERLRETVFRKLEVDEVEKKTRSKDFRIQMDVGGFTLGPHPDSPEKKS